jgi:putative transposase
MAPPPLDGTRPAETGTPDRRCLNPSAREADGRGESALGCTADSWRTAQSRHRRLERTVSRLGKESAASWTEVVANLAARHLARPVLAVIDGNPGLTAALRSHWPGIAMQRCTAHKLRNLQAKAPARLREELTEDYRRMIYGETVAVVEQARARFTKKWHLRCPAVVESLKEAGDELFTFLRFPRSQWKPLRTTNALERINEESRRRTKTQASLPSQDAVLLLLFGLLRTGQIKLRTLDGYQHMKEVEKAA